MGKHREQVIDFYEDPSTGEPHIYKHDVVEEDVLDVLLKRTENHTDDFAGLNGARIAFGQTEAGRYLKVVYKRESAKNRIFVITAYDLTGKPLAAFRKRTKKRR